MVFIPPPHLVRSQSRTPQTPEERARSRHETTIGMLVVFGILLGIALFLIIAGPHLGNNPPPLAVTLVVSGMAALFGFVAFVSWLHEQGADDSDRTTSES